jgi:hypothetical protein
MLAATNQPVDDLCFRTLYMNQRQAERGPMDVQPTATASMSDFTWTYEVLTGGSRYSRVPGPSVKNPAWADNDWHHRHGGVQKHVETPSVLKATWSGSFENGGTGFCSGALWKLPPSPTLPNAPTIEKQEKYDRERDAWCEGIFEESFTLKVYVTRKPGETILIAALSLDEVHDEGGDESVFGSTEFERVPVIDDGRDDRAWMDFQVLLNVTPDGMTVTSCFYESSEYNMEQMESDEVLLWLERRVPWEAALSFPQQHDPDD